MLNSIGIPLPGVAPPIEGGAAVEQPMGAGGFATLLAAALGPVSPPPTALLEAGAAGVDGATMPDSTRGIDGGILLDDTPAIDVETPPLNGLEPALAGAKAIAPPVDVDRPDRSSEAEVSDLADARSMVEPSDAEGWPLAAVLAGLGMPAPVPPPSSPAPAAVDGVSVVERPLAPEHATVAEVVSEASAVLGTPAPPGAARARRAPKSGEPDPTSATEGASASTRPVAGKPDDISSTAPFSLAEASEETPAAGGPAASRAPEDRLGEQIRELAPQERNEVASAWNRAGGRFEGNPPPVPAEASDQATEASSRGAGEVESPAHAAPGAPHATSELPSTPALVERRAADDQPLEVARVTEEASPAAAGVGQVAPRPIEVAPPPSEQTAPPLETRDVAALQRGLADSVQAAVRRAAPNGDETIRLVLNPPELGHLEVRVTTGSEGVRVEVTASTSDATDLIRQQLPALVTGLEARELRVDRADVRQALGAELGADLGSREPRSGSRQPGDRAADGQPQWARPEWSGVAALERAAARAVERRSEQASSRLLDLVA